MPRSVTLPALVYDSTMARSPVGNVASAFPPWIVVPA